MRALRLHARFPFVPIYAVVILAIVAAGQAGASPLFRDDFDVDGPPDPADWVVNHPGECWWVMGRTHFPCPEVGWDPERFPVVENGSLLITHHLFNPYDGGDPNTTFLGGEVHSTAEFDPDASYRFEARVRLNPGDSPYFPYPDGLVTSFFLYGHDGSKSDEIDYEFLSNLLLTSYNDPFLTNAWNESVEKPVVVAAEGLDLTEWNTFRIYWDPGVRIEWTWLDPVHGETTLRTETDPAFVPDEPMAVYFNFWAPSAIWGDAYDEIPQPVNSEGENEIYLYEIDYVEVVPEPTTTLLLACGLTGLAVAGRRRSPH